MEPAPIVVSILQSKLSHQKTVGTLVTQPSGSKGKSVEDNYRC